MPTCRCRCQCFRSSLHIQVLSITLMQQQQTYQPRQHGIATFTSWGHGYHSVWGLRNSKLCKMHVVVGKLHRPQVGAVAEANESVIFVGQYSRCRAAAAAASPTFACVAVVRRYSLQLFDYFIYHNMHVAEETENEYINNNNNISIIRSTHAQCIKCSSEFY